MKEFIIKYWLQFLFGLIVTGITAYYGRIHKTYIKGKEAVKEEDDQELIEQFKEIQKGNQEQVLTAIDSINEKTKELDGKFDILKEGVLSIQGRDFKNECRCLLEDEHTISLNEYENICSDHTAYKALGGNHEGDTLFELVKMKYQSCLKNKKTEEV